MTSYSAQRCLQSKRNMRRCITVRHAVLATCLLSSGFVATVQADTPDFSFGGFIKLDAVTTNTTDGKLPSGSIGREFYIPGLTPIGGESNTYTDFHARETRFWFRADQTLSNGETITGHIELDFLGTPGGDARVTNSYSPRVRHAYIRYGNWLAGQFWSNFQDVTILPEAHDFIGANDGVVFMRQPQIRYSPGNGWSFSLERPETTVTPFQGGNSRVTTGDSAMPDLTARYQNQTGKVHYSVAALVRQLEYRDTAAGVDDTEIAWGINLTSKIDIGRHDLRLGVVHGAGLGRYVGINSTNDAVVVPAEAGTAFNLDAIEITGFSAAYRHVWTEQYRTSFIVTRAELKNNEALAGLGANDSTQRVAANLMYDANDALTLGFELSRGSRQILSGDKGHINRVQVSVRYGF